MAKKTQTPMELAIEIAERESKKWFKIAEDTTLPVGVRTAALENSKHLDDAVEHLKLVQE